MALSAHITTEQGFDVAAAYVAIQDFTADKLTAEDGTKSFNVQVHLNTFKDSTKAICLYGENFSIPLPYNNGVVALADLYTQIKLLPEFTVYQDA